MVLYPFHFPLIQCGRLGRACQGRKLRKFFVFVLFEAHKAGTAEKLRAAVLVTTKWVTCHGGFQDIIIRRRIIHTEENLFKI